MHNLKKQPKKKVQDNKKQNPVGSGWEGRKSLIPFGIATILFFTGRIADHILLKIPFKKALSTTALIAKG